MSSFSDAMKNLTNSVKGLSGVLSGLDEAEERNSKPGPFTSLGFRSGLSFIVGGTASGKTTMLLNLVEEALQTRRDVQLNGDYPELRRRLEQKGPLPGSLRLLDGLDDLEMRVKEAEEGDIFFVDDFMAHLGLRLGGERHSNLEQAFRTWTGILDGNAKRHDAAVIMTMPLSRPNLTGSGGDLVPRWLGRAYPVFRLKNNPRFGA